MESTELDTALEELEVRLERLRALYEQYFLGIEKLEPAIARKDVDRRIFVLRREKIRNTGKRFKLQTLIQRYNTFQQYWMRICREIENGTYRRHVLRAERTIGPTDLMTIAARRRFGKARGAVEGSTPDEPNVERSPSARPGSSAAARRPTTNPPSSRSRTPTLPGLPTPPPAATVEPLAARQGSGSRHPTPERNAAARQAAARQAATPAGQRRSTTPPLGSRPPPPASFESLELDMDFMGDWDPQTRPKGRPLGRPDAAPVPSKNVPAQPAAAAGAPGPALPRPRLAPPPKPGRPAAPAAAPEARQVTPLAIPDAGPPDEQTTRFVAARAAAAAVPPRSSPTPAAGTPSVRPMKPEVAPRHAGVEIPIIPAPARVPAEARSVPERPAIARSPRAPVEARPPVAKEAPAKPAADSNVTDARVRELHTRLLEANKQAGQKPVSLDGLAKSLRAAEAKLRAQHGNRRIDFEVILKEGKPVVKPVVR